MLDYWGSIKGDNKEGAAKYEQYDYKNLDSFNSIFHKLNEYTSGLVRELRRTSFIKLFADTLGNYMPEASQLKHFNSAEVAEKFLRANNLFLEKRVEESTGGMTAAMDSVMNAAETLGDQPIKEQDGREEEA